MNNPIQSIACMCNTIATHVLTWILLAHRWLTEVGKLNIIKLRVTCKSKASFELCDQWNAGRGKEKQLNLKKTLPAYAFNQNKN